MSHAGDNDGDMSNIELTEHQQKIGNLIKISPTITICQMSETQSVSKCIIKHDYLPYRILEYKKNRIYGNAANHVVRSSIDDSAKLVNFSIVS